ncbi:ribonuclease P protein component [Sphingobacterium sp. IITKGP-BTPF85]|uniref:ribonuclease P protein component n=1 Tax=Sphingobacterium sp. IITKGP-BTPF85 TaxID=1338009 RepID=UPI00038A0883|nr:ribonuclease P protein component [Sphingobacterium sp. IITKGP-BTPF85]KKX49793.1 hypothetical protein L950_0213920 [Sphingobacterium sp. IITKGP-BTPF85]
MSEETEKFSYTFKKNERLSSKKRIDNMFNNGKSFISYPLRVIYVSRLDDSVPPVSVFISVRKRKIKVVPKRNRVKRVIKEVYRLNKYQFIELARANRGLDIGFLYLHHEPLRYTDIEKALLKIAAKMKLLFEGG